MILRFSFRIFVKEWRKLLLPFFSIALTAGVVSTAFLLVDSTRSFLEEKNKTFIGGDIAYESATRFEYKELLSVGVQKKVDSISNQITFSSILESGSSTSGASLQFIDQSYPLYGSINLQNKTKGELKQNEIYIDKTLQNALGADLGSFVIFNNKEFVVKDIIVSDPESILNGFNFSGKAIMSNEAIEYSGINLELFRKEFKTKIRLTEKLNKEEIKVLRDIAKEKKVRSEFDGSGSSNFSFGIETVEKFLVVTILIISILALVNIYAAVNYLSGRLRRSFAVLIALGMPVINIYKILFTINFINIASATFVGIVAGYFITRLIQMEVLQVFSLGLGGEIDFIKLLIIFVSILVTSVFATIPVINRLRKISPKELLGHNGQTENKSVTKNIVLDVLIGIFPVTLFAIYFLDSLYIGLIAILGIVGFYGLVMIGYFIFINIIYNRRHGLPFSLKLIIAQKKFDGFFGLIAFASLFVALLSVFTLSITRTSISGYLQNNLKQSVPSTYIIDVQKSQREELLKNFSNITLFPNVRARIVRIGDIDIQKELSQSEPKIDRELGREFNLTYRDNLLPSEKVSSGVFGIGEGEVSLEKDFAERANIKMGDKVSFLIQGFEITSTVTSIREVDTRSGYPFFYFVFGEKVLADFPTTYFGFTNIDKNKYVELKEYLAKSAPNITTIDTGEITKVAEDLIGILLLVILVITLPPLFLSAFLIITIVSTLAVDRKRDGARLMALGKTHKYLRNYYIVESVSTTLLASVIAYLSATVISSVIIVNFLKIKDVAIFDQASIYILSFILIGISAFAFASWRSGTKSLREYLNYEDNN